MKTKRVYKPLTEDVEVQDLIIETYNRKIKIEEVANGRILITMIDNRTSDGSLMVKPLFSNKIIIL